jgi:molybdate transport system substrate-binding protein
MKRLLAIALLLSACGQKPAPQALRIAAASDLRFALDELAADFHREHPGISVNVSYGSSGTFFAQLVNGAPFDVFLSADLSYPRQLAERGATLANSEFMYAVGRIVLWVPAESPIDVGRLGMRALQEPGIEHIAIANPEHAPYGRAAVAAMESAGVYNAVRPKLVYGENVQQALQFVQSGAADVGIVALSLALAPAIKPQGRYADVPLETYPRIVQGGVILRWAADAAAARSLRAFLMAAEGRAVLKQYGFFMPEE